MRKPYHRPDGRFSQPTEAAGRERRPRTFGIMLIFTPCYRVPAATDCTAQFRDGRTSPGGYRVTVSLFRFTTAARVWSTDDRP